MAWNIIDTKTGKTLMVVHTAYAAEQAAKVPGLKAEEINKAAA